MKKRIFAALTALCLLAGTSAFAQDQKMQRPDKQQWTPEQIAQKKSEMMKQKLNLNDEQTKQVYNYTLEQVKQAKMHRDAMRAARKAEAEKMKTILTPEQYEQWQQMQGPKFGERHGQMHKDGKGGKGAKECKGGDCNNKPAK